MSLNKHAGNIWYLVESESEWEWASESEELNGIQGSLIQPVLQRDGQQRGRGKYKGKTAPAGHIKSPILTKSSSLLMVGLGRGYRDFQKPIVL